MMTRRAPAWVQAASAVTRRVPRGRYYLTALLRGRAAPFIAQLDREIGGAQFECSLADAIAREVCLTGLYEPPVSALVARWLQPDSVVVDVGANWGYFTLLCAALAPLGHIFAIEADPRHHAQLARNVALNGFTHVTTLHAAAGAAAGEVSLVVHAPEDDNRGTTRVAFDARAATDAVACVPIDAIVADVPRVDLVKIDVEGFELQVLEGLEDSLARGRCRAIVLELHPALLREQGLAASSCVARLERHGYRGWTIDLSAGAYRRAARRASDMRGLLLPLPAWQESAWPHLLFLAPGEQLR